MKNFSTIFQPLGENHEKAQYYLCRSLLPGSRADLRLWTLIYILYHVENDGKVIEEKVRRQFADGTTPARAARIRAECIEGKLLSRKEIREGQKAHREEEKIVGLLPACGMNIRPIGRLRV
jgi:hypothetical protein